MVDESSTAYYTVQALRTVKDLTVISNSLEILRLARVRGPRAVKPGRSNFRWSASSTVSPAGRGTAR